MVVRAKPYNLLQRWDYALTWVSHNQYAVVIQEKKRQQVFNIVQCWQRHNLDTTVLQHLTLLVD